MEESTAHTTIIHTYTEPVVAPEKPQLHDGLRGLACARGEPPFIDPFDFETFPSLTKLFRKFQAVGPKKKLSDQENTERIKKTCMCKHCGMVFKAPLHLRQHLNFVRCVSKLPKKTFSFVPEEGKDTVRIVADSLWEADQIYGEPIPIMRPVKAFANKHCWMTAQQKRDDKLAYHKNYYRKHDEHIKDQVTLAAKRRREEDPEKYAAQRLKYSRAAEEVRKAKGPRKVDPEKQKQYRKTYYDKHHDDVLEKRRQWSSKPENREKIKEYRDSHKKE